MGETGAGDAAAAVASKKARVEDTVEEQDFDKETQSALEEIDSCQNDIDAMNEKASEEILKVEQKYNTLRRPFFDKRNEIIKRIPKFWLTAFINHPQISGIIEEDEEDALQHLVKVEVEERETTDEEDEVEEDEEDALQHLVKVEVEEFEDIKSGYKIKFHFEKNAYFDNEVLCKEYQLGSNGDPTSTSTEIKWKEGFNLTAKAAQRAALVKGSRKRRLENRTFFTWFCDNQDPSVDDIGEVIKDDMW